MDKSYEPFYYFILRMCQLNKVRHFYDTIAQCLLISDLAGTARSRYSFKYKVVHILLINQVPSSIVIPRPTQEICEKQSDFGEIKGASKLTSMQMSELRLDPRASNSWFYAFLPCLHLSLVCMSLWAAVASALSPHAGNRLQQKDEGNMPSAHAACCLETWS